MNLASLSNMLTTIKMAAEDLSLSGEISCEHDQIFIQFSDSVSIKSRLHTILIEDGWSREEDYLYSRWV